MPDLTITIQGTEALDAALARAEQDIAAASEEAQRQVAPQIAAAVAAETPVRTGFLRSSERFEPLSAFQGQFTAAAPYASFVAYGTRFMTANPFVERGVTRVEPEVAATFEAAFDDYAERF